MNVADQLMSGLELTLAGMVTVFVLLSFMVLIIHWMSKLAHRLQPPQHHEPIHASRHADGELSPTLVSVISTAVHRFRGSRSQ